MEGLPVLPGYSFTDPSRCNFTVGHNLVWKNGYPVAKRPEVGIGGQPLVTEGILYSHSADPVSYDPSLTYGRTKGYQPSTFQPHFLQYAGKCLTFRAFFEQSIEDSPLESGFRVRHVNIIYFLEDDTITVMEPKIENAGFQQGRIVKRGRVRKLDTDSFWHWKDFDLGIDININGVIYHICDSDRYTRKWLESQGMELGRPQEMPLDAYTQRRELEDSIPTKTSHKVQEDKYRKFLKWDTKALTFLALWDCRAEENGALRKVRLHYNLADDTIDIYEHQDASERSTFGSRAILKKARVPKVIQSMEAGYHDDDPGAIEYMSPTDLIVGKTVFVLGRSFYIYDCDEFTRNHYRVQYFIEQPKEKLPQEPPKEPVVRKIPPYTGIGSHADSMLSYYYLDPKSGQIADKMAFIRYLQRSNLRLRYTAEMDHVHPEDKNRQFVIEYRLCDGHVMIHELQQRNSGFTGGRFLKHTLVPKTGTNPDNPEYFTPHDFRLGAVIEVYGHRFRITGVDLAVYRYMQANPEKFPEEQVEEVRKHLLREGHLAEDIKEVSEYRKQEELTEIILPVEEELPAEKQLPRTDFRIRKHRND